MEPPESSRSPRSILRAAAGRLREAGAGNPELEAEYLLCAALDEDRVGLLRRRPEDPLPEAAVGRFAELLARRLSHEPLQYVLGTVPFCEIDLEVGPGVLIPRGETEVLVDRVSAAMGDLRAAGGARPPLVVDVGTGSGAILLALMARFPGWAGIGIDRSPAALGWARRNAERITPRAVGVEAARVEAARVEPPAQPRAAALVRGDLLAPIRSGCAAVVVSNPPYIRAGEIADLAPEIRDHEPREALDGGQDGLAPFRRLLVETVRVLAPGGLFAVELAPDQPARAEELALATGIFERTAVFQDLAARARGLLAWRRATG